MTPPKKAFFSLNIDSQIESLPPPSVTHHDTQDSFGKKVIEVSGPIAGSSKIEIVKNKAGKTSKRIEGFGTSDQDTGKEADDRDPGHQGLSYSTTKTTTDGPSVHTTTTRKETRPLDDIYDTSDL
jgi:hypothetical protein